MTTKPSKKTRSAIDNTAGGRANRKRATKGGRLVQLLKSGSGRDVTALSAKLGWQPHSTRAALSRLRKAGYSLEKLPPLKHGRTRYRISSAPAGPAR